MSNPFITIINQSLPEPQASLLAGILFGIKTSLPKNLMQDLITTGTIHIIALSGQNISILTQIVSQLTLVLGRKVSSLVTIGFIIAFVLFVGLEPTIIRAAIMGSVSLLAVVFGKQNLSLLSLILAASIMLIINPVWITTISFQLSFFATLGIIIFGTTKQSKPQNFIQEIIREVKISLRTTLAAQAFTIPLIWFYFKQISLISPLTNVLIGWVIAPLMFLGIVLSLVGLVWLPLGQMMGLLTWVPLTFIISVVELTSKIPYAALKF